MNKCCEGKQTAYCPECGANLKKRSLLGLVEDLTRRIDRACETRTKHGRLLCSADVDVVKKAEQGLTRAEDTIQQLSCWRELLKDKE